MIISDVAILLKEIGKYAVIAANGDFSAVARLKSSIQNLRFCTKNDNLDTEKTIRDFFCKGVVSVENNDIYNPNYSNRKNYSHLKEIFSKENWEKW